MHVPGYVHNVNIYAIAIAIARTNLLALHEHGPCFTTPTHAQAHAHTLKKGSSTKLPIKW